MKVIREFPTKRFQDADRGAVISAIFGRNIVVRGIKAHFAANGGPGEDYLVSIGPFYAEHGNRPVVYRSKDLTEPFVVDITGHCHLTPSVEASDLILESAESEKAPGILLLLDDGRVLMRVANFGRAGPSQVMYLDVATGELAHMGGEERFLATRRWHVFATNEQGEAASDFEFVAEI